MTKVSARFVLSLTLSFLCISSHAQFPSRQSLEVHAVVRQTADGSHYIYPSHSISLYDTVEQTFAGGSLSYAYAFHRNLALEADAGYLFGSQPQVPQSGGRQTMAHLGLRASVPIGHSRFSFTMHAAPGVDSFSSAIRSQTYTLLQLNPSGVFTYSSIPTYGRITHFSLQQGLGLSDRLTSRTALTLDVSDDISLRGDRSQVLPGESFTTIAEAASIEDHPVISLGLRHSFGHAFASPSELAQAQSPLLTELVISYAFQPTLSADDSVLQAQIIHESGVALTGSHFLKPWFALDSSVIYLHNGASPSFHAGGPQLQFFAGVKVGIQRRCFGLYAKARPGLIVFTHAFSNVSGTPPPPGALDQFGGDIGSVFELYPVHGLVLRFDIGETLVRYAPVTPVSGYGTNYDPLLQTSQPQFLFGAGWRF